MENEGYRIRSGGCCPDCNNPASNPCDFMKSDNELFAEFVAVTGVAHHKLQGMARIRLLRDIYNKVRTDYYLNDDVEEGH